MRERTTKPCNIVNDKLKTMEKYKMYLKKIMQTEPIYVESIAKYAY